MPDHFWIPFGPVAALTSAAESTTRLRLGSFVFCNDFRHPAVLAKEAATLDLLTEGRFELGLGAGYGSDEYAQAGISFDSARTRIERLAESVQVLKALFGEGAATFTGRHYQITDLAGLPKPTQQPHPPILIGGGGRSILSLAAREADIVGLAPRVVGARADPNSLSVAGTLQKLEWIKAAGGERFAHLELNIYFGASVMVTNDPRGAARIISDQRRSAYGISPDDVLESPHFAVGSIEQIVDALQERRERFGISYLIAGRAALRTSKRSPPSWRASPEHSARLLRGAACHKRTGCESQNVRC